MQYLYLLRRYPTYIGYGLLHYFFTAPGQTFFISLYATSFAAALSLDTVQFDWYYAGATLLSAFTLPWVGSWLDRVKLRYVSVAIGLAFAGFCGLAAIVSHPYLLFFALFGLRLCGQGLLGLTASTATARFFEETRGQALSLVSFGVSISEVILPPLVTSILFPTVGWRSSWFLIAALVLLVFIPLVIRLIPINSPFQLAPPEAASDSPHSVQSVSRRQVLSRPSFYLLTTVYLFVPFFMTGIMINKHLLGEANGWSESYLAWGLSMFGLTRLIANLVGGPLIDRFSARRVFSFMLIPMALGTLTLMISDHPAVMIAFFLLSGVSASLNSLASTAMWAELYGPRHLGAIRSMVSTFMVFGTAVAPVVLGWALGFPEEEWLVMLVSAALMLLLTVAAFWQTRRLGRQPAPPLIR
jgi:MFS family permease